MFEIIYGINVSEIQIQKSLEAANYANRNCDGASVCILSDGKTAIISVVTILLKPKDFQTVFPTVVEMIEEAESAFTSQLRK